MLGRIVKTIFILRYSHEEKIRRRVQLQRDRAERFTNWRLGPSLPLAGVSHRGLRGDYEQGKLPESGIECVFHEHARTNDCGGAPT